MWISIHTAVFHLSIWAFLCQVKQYQANTLCSTENSTCLPTGILCCLLVSQYWIWIFTQSWYMLLQVSILHHCLIEFTHAQFVYDRTPWSSFKWLRSIVEPTNMLHRDETRPKLKEIMLVDVESWAESQLHMKSGSLDHSIKHLCLQSQCRHVSQQPIYERERSSWDSAYHDL